MLGVRAFKNMLRNRLLFVARVVQTVGLGLIIMAVYGPLDTSQESPSLCLSSGLCFRGR